MNKFTKALIVGTAAISTLAMTLETASAADWQRRGFRGFHGNAWRYHHGPGFRGRWAAAGVLGLAAGVIVGEALSQPRVVYRDRADVVEEDPGYVERDDAPEYVGPVDEYGDPDDEGYVQERTTTQHRVYKTQRDTYSSDDQGQYDDQSRMNDQAEDDNYFPAAPQKEHHQTRNKQVAEQTTLEPWTAKWRTYCKQHFPSFNSTTGKYTGYDGKSHFCKAG
jgi:hypothetical protein